MLQNNVDAKGHLTIELFDKDGSLIDTQSIKNVVVNNGLNYIASRMKDATALQCRTWNGSDTALPLVTLSWIRTWSSCIDFNHCIK